MEIQTTEICGGSRDFYIEAEIQIEGWRYHHSNLQSNIEIRGRGHYCPIGILNKPYQIKFDTATSVLSMPKRAQVDTACGIC